MNSEANLKKKSTSLELVEYIQNKADISFEDVTFEVPDVNNTNGQGKQLLKHITGIFKAGEMTAILGSSGAGKSTLLNIITGKTQKYNGKVLVNNTKLTYDNFGCFGNYVTQENILMQTLTVKQTLEFHARMKIPNEYKALEVIKSLVDRFKLTSCLNTFIGGDLVKGVSGGQKKRVSIIIQLLSDPKVFILDEPTSDLDSLTAFIIMKQLKNLAEIGKTIILTIHQPSNHIFELFDNLLLMMSGHIIYQGKPRSALTYFDSKFNLKCPEFMNPAQFLVLIAHKSNEDRLQQFVKQYKIQEQAVMIKINDKLQQPIIIRQIEASSYKAFGLLLKRDYDNIVRNPFVMQARILQILTISIFSGGLFFSVGRNDYIDPNNWRAISGFIFFISFDLIMQSLLAILLTFPMERKVFEKEQSSKMYSILPYFLSRNIIQIPYTFIVPLAFMLINYWMIGLGNTAEQFFSMYLILVVMFFTGTSVGMLFGSIFDTLQGIVSVFPLIYMPLIIFSGLFKNSASMPAWIGWVRFISPFYYSFNSLIKNETMYKQSRVDELNLNELGKWHSLLVLFCYGIVCRIITFIALSLRKIRPK